MNEASLVATLTMPPSTSGFELAALPDTVAWLEVRSDLTGELDPEWLRSHFRGRLLFSLRSRTKGGAYEGSTDQRHDYLRRAAQSYDLIELEHERDSSPDLLAQIPIEKRLVSWYGPACDLAKLKDRFIQLSAVPAKFYKLVTDAESCSDELVPLSLLKSLKRRDTIAYSIGPLGFWSRIIAPRLGAPFIFSVVPGGPVALTEPTVASLIEDYGLPHLPPLEAIYGIVGSPVVHSLSPRLHNAAFGAMNYPAIFLPFHAETFSEFWHEVVNSGLLESLNIPIKGLTVVSPHKEAAARITSVVSPMVRRAESANILVLGDGLWKADTTDTEVVFMAAREREIQLNQKRVAVIGCGGAGRTIAATLDQLGGNVTLVNKNEERGYYASRLLGLPFTPLQEFSADGFDMIINATPLGRDDGEVPFALDTLEEDSVVIDLVYGSEPTPLIARARALGCVAIDGREVLLAQVLRQFQLMTGKEIPTNLLHEKLGLEFEHSDLVGSLSQ